MAESAVVKQKYPEHQTACVPGIFKDVATSVWRYCVRISRNQFSANIGARIPATSQKAARWLFQMKIIISNRNIYFAQTHSADKRVVLDSILSKYSMLLFRRGYLLHLWYSHHAATFFCAHKRRQNVLKECLKNPSPLCGFICGIQVNLRFFTLFAVCVFKGTRAVRSDTSLWHCLFFA